MSKESKVDKKPGGEHPEKASEPKAGAPKGAPSHGGGNNSAPSSSSKNAGAKVGCHAVGCKDKDVRFNFCEEHFRHFKFGLITKAGEKVFDYERKLEHYQKANRVGKVAKSA